MPSKGACLSRIVVLVWCHDRTQAVKVKENLFWLKYQMSQAHMGTCQSCQQTHSTGHKPIFITAVNRLRHRESSEDYFYKRLY